MVGLHVANTSEVEGGYHIENAYFICCPCFPPNKGSPKAVYRYYKYNKTATFFICVYSRMNAHGSDGLEKPSNLCFYKQAFQEAHPEFHKSFTYSGFSQHRRDHDLTLCAAVLYICWIWPTVQE